MSVAHTSSPAVALHITRRSLLLIPRVPSTFIPSLIFPVFTVVVFSNAFGAVAQLPGFPVSKMLDWMLPMAVVQGAAFTGLTIGLGAARDLESGFFDRFLTAPVRPVAILAGAYLAAMVRAVIPVALVIGAGLASGADLRGGLAGLGVLFIAAEGAALAAGGWGLGLALRAKTVRIAPLMQVGIFLAVFLSTAQVPLDVMTGWLHAVARVNPTTYVLGLGRQGFLGSVTWGGTWPGLVAIAGMGAFFGVFALRGLRTLRP